jgi:hypothetical protein
MKTTDPPSGVVEWYSGKTGERVYMHLKAKLTGRRMPDGTQYSSIVNLSEADADRLIANIKKDSRGYPGFNDGGGGAKFYENYEAYQKWLVEEYLENPFSAQVDEKIEDAAARRRINEAVKKAKEKREKAQAFISKTSAFRPGKRVSLKTTRMAGIVPKRAIPGGVDQKLASEPSEEVGIEPTKTMIGSLGRVTLDLVQINDNLDAIREVIIEDYKTTRETNKKEAEEYRKRIANRGRKLPKKDLGDSKKNLGEIIKPFVNGFFSGAGGAIRALAAFNLIEAFMNGDYLKVFKSLMGIGITFIPQIATMIAGSIIKSLLKGFARRRFGGGFGGGRMGSPMRGGGGVGGIGKLGAALSLGTGALALGSAFAASQQDDTSTETQDQTRLEELTTEQKGLTDTNIAAITQADLKKFEELNKKFEAAVDILLRNKGMIPAGAGGPGGGSSAGAEISNEEVNMDSSMRGSVTGQEFNNEQLVALAKKVGATDEEAVRLAAIAKYESGGDPRAHNDNYLRGGGDNSYGLWQINMLGRMGDQRRSQYGISRNEQLWDPVTNAQAALHTLRSSGWGAWTTNSKVTQRDLEQGRRNLRSSPPPTPPSPAQPAPPRRTPDQVSATPSSGPRVAVVPVPQLAGGDSPGSFNSNGSGAVASVDPKNYEDVYGKLYRTGWNVVG